MCFEARDPLIVPKQHTIDNLLIRHYHNILTHAGPEHILSQLTGRFWIIHAQSAIRKTTGICVSCTRRHGERMSQLIGKLPPTSLEAYIPPYTRTRLHCFGPLKVKRVRITVKRWGVILNCLATPAVHLGVMDILTTDSFLEALMRLVARGGYSM